MSGLSDKSQMNMQAADVLQKAYLYSSVCHPAYYACIQLMISKVLELDDIELSTLGSYMSQSGGRSHKYVIDKIDVILKDKERHGSISFDDYKTFKNNIRDLKTARVKADYTNEKISQTDSAKFVLQIVSKL